MKQPITEIDHSLYCSIHERRLEVSEIRTSKDAYVGRVAYFVKPCPKCEDERSRIKNALKEIKELSQ